MTWGQKSGTNAGTASNLLLRFAASSRVSGISEAYTGLANDENAILYNPGGLPNLNSGVFSLNHAEWLEDIRIDNIIYGQKLTYNSTVGLSITHMWMPSIQGKDQYGQETGAFNVSSSIVQLGMGYKIHPAFYIGIAAKYFQDQLANYNAAGFAFDMGFLMHTAIKNLSVGFSVQNLGDKIKYDKLSQNLPLTFRGGLAYQLFNKQLCVSADVVKSADTDFNINTGLEYNFEQSFFIRLGNQFSNTRSLYPSYGLGFVIKQRLETNYTFGSLEDLGTTHKVGFTFRFNKPDYNNSNRKKYSSYLNKKTSVKNGIQLIKSDNELLISWNSVDYAAYNIYVKCKDHPNWIKINSKPQKSTYRRIKKPCTPGKYYFKVTYILNNREYPISKEATFDVK